MRFYLPIYINFIILLTTAFSSFFHIKLCFFDLFFIFGYTCNDICGRKQNKYIYFVFFF
nr:MAG TPA: hypothetical protein [Caudoviricetes sp.]